VDPTESRQDQPRRSQDDGALGAMGGDHSTAPGPQSAYASFGLLGSSVSTPASTSGAPAAATARTLVGRAPGPLPAARSDEPTATEPSTPPRSMVKGLVGEARPRQWIKNLLVFVAPAAGGVLLHWGTLWHGAAAFFIFCLAASGVYFLNDAVDVRSDRLHPTKRFRPIAAGVVPLPLALVIALVLLASAVGSAALLAGRDLATVMALYAIANVAYSVGLKNEPILDLALGDC
jgi:hypothetical protein